MTKSKINIKKQYQELYNMIYMRCDNMEQTKLVDKLEQMEKALDEGYSGLITNIEETTNEEYFGEETKGTYTQRKGLKISVKIDSPEGAEFDQFFAFPKITGLRQSNIGLFKKRYGSFPKKGLKVDVIINEDGFFRVVI